MSKIQQIATTLAVSVSTVSRALKNNPRISLAMREKVLAEARKIGYRPDHLLSQAMRSLRSGANSIHYNIAYWWPGELGISGSRFENPEGDCLVQAISRICKEMHISCLFKHTDRLPDSIPALIRVLKARGVSGLMLGAGDMAHIPYAIPQSLFSFPLVSVRATPLDNAVTVIDSDYSSAYHQIFEQAKNRGYKRPGVIVRVDRESHYEPRYIGCYYYYMSYLKAFDKIPMLEPDSMDSTYLARKLQQWIRRYKPDIIISPYHRILWVLKENLGLKIPADIAYVGTNFTFLEKRITAPQIDVERIAYESVLAVIDQIEGIKPTLSSEKVVRIKPVWKEGDTMPALSGRKTSSRKSGK